ncbi:Kunitz/Bovine pancreatic trypsin inhibitor domain [Popillia japonica]|uniref:Kunitz/Bovine pancreatic trypsin inhibitor domain n=1 Tax=Popillia japonica TaxID=7064 RepID=A0AAW1M0T5_POPJA
MYLCAASERKILPHICSLPADPGPCDANISRFYHNVTTGKCEDFIFGGCAGNIIDWKNKTKGKVSQIKRHCTQIGGRSPSSKLLSDLEERLIKLIGRKTIYGDETIKEMGFTIKPTFTESINIENPLSGMSILNTNVQDYIEQELVTVEVSAGSNVAVHSLNHDHDKYCIK